MAEPKRTKRTILQGQLETTVGVDPGTWGAANAIPVYDAFNVIQADIETQQLNRARATLDASGYIIGIPSYTLGGNCYVFGTGDPVAGYAALGNLPSWAIFLRGAGFTPVAPVLGEVVFSPVSEAHDSVYFRAWLDGHLHTAGGCRGNLVFSADAGNPVGVAFDYMGIYNKATVDAGIADVASDPGNPPRWCGLDSFRLIAQNGGVTNQPDPGDKVFSPLVKSFNLDLGVTPVKRINANAANCLEEIGIYQEYDPKLSVVVEVEEFDLKLDNASGRVNDFIEAMNQGDRFAFELNVGSYTASTGEGARWTFSNSSDLTVSTGLADTTTFGAQLSTAPQYSDQDGIRTYELEFTLTGTNNNWMRVVAR